ncbi:MAG: S24/S26 family peptidase [Jatrophihabitantaceae bacterium]
MDAVIAWQRVWVEGASMTPTLLAGDWLLVRHGAQVVPGAIVLAEFRSEPGLLVLKRVTGERAGGWWLASDNARVGSDSRQYGVADVHAVVVWQWCRGPGRRASWRSRWLGRRPPAAPPDGL